MDYLLADEFGEAGEDLAHHIEYLLFLEFFAFHELLEIAVFTELSDDVETVLGGEDVFELDDIGVVESLEEIYFREDGILEIFVIGKGGQVDLLDGHFLLGLPLHPLVDLPVDALPQALGGLVGVVPYHLDYHLGHQPYITNYIQICLHYPIISTSTQTEANLFTRNWHIEDEEWVIIVNVLWAIFVQIGIIDASFSRVGV